MTDVKLKRIIKLLDKAMDGIEEYAETLEDTGVISDPLEKIYDIIENEILDLGLKNLSKTTTT